MYCTPLQKHNSYLYVPIYRARSYESVSFSTRYENYGHIFFFAPRVLSATSPFPINLLCILDLSL